MGADGAAFEEHGAGAGDEVLHHGAEVGGEDAACELALVDVEVAEVFAGEVAAATVGVFDDVLPEVGELECGADFVGEQGEIFFAVAADPEDEATDGIGGVVGVFEELVPVVVGGLDLVHAKGVEEIREELAREIAG